MRRTERLVPGLPRVPSTGRATQTQRERGELFSSGAPLDTEVEKMLLLSRASEKTPYQQLNDFVNS